MAYASSSPRERVMAALPSVAAVAAIGWALLFGLASRGGQASEDGLKLFQPIVPPAPERVRPVPPPRHIHRPRGEAAPPNIRSVATEVVAPVPVIPPLQPPPVLVAPVADTGTATTAGAAPLPGPGTGAGGQGNGRGSGGSGDGDGDGDETPPRRIKGKITDRDWPPGAAAAGAGGVVSVRYFVEVDGRATGCRVTHSSGDAQLDAVTCRLIEQRFRYRPSLDADGRPVRSVIVVDHEWINDLGPPTQPVDRFRG